MQNEARPKNIRLLPPELRNQIAAGEVVERPASVVKELVENSLDAGASSVHVRLEQGGQSLVLVQDDGCGIAPDQLELAVTRHATSKLVDLAGLLNIESYGFRGEALPSIASVSRFALSSVLTDKTRPQGPDGPDAPYGSDYGPEMLQGADGSNASHSPENIDNTQACRIEVEHGRLLRLCPTALRRGTRVEVRDLFSNIPARLKFLKNPATEYKRALDWLMRLALARPDVAFTVESGTRETLRLPAGQDLLTRLAALWPPSIMDELLPFDADLQGIRAHGLASRPTSSQSRADRLLFYVNGRSISDRRLLAAVREAYKGRLTSRDYPQVALFLEIDPREVDVNAHPAKSEVRFRDEQRVFLAVRRALERVVQPGAGQASPAAFGLAPVGPVQGRVFPAAAASPRATGFWGLGDRPGVRKEAPSTYKSPARRFAEEASSPLAAYAAGSVAEEAAPPLANPAAVAEGLPLPDSVQVSSGCVEQGRACESGAGLAALLAAQTGLAAGLASGLGPDMIPGLASSFRASAPDSSAAFGLEREARAAARLRVGPYIFLGQVGQCYLVLCEESSATLVLVDQHAMHERVLFARMERQAFAGQGQGLLLPVEMPLHPVEKENLPDLLEALLALGFELELQEDSLRVCAIPPILDRAEAILLLREMLGGEDRGPQRLFVGAACKAAIKAGQSLSPDEAAELLAQWLELPPDLRDFCPHGRPCIVRFAPPDLEKLFKRRP